MAILFIQCIYKYTRFVHKRIKNRHFCNFIDCMRDLIGLINRPRKCVYQLPIISVNGGGGGGGGGAMGIFL